MVKAKNKSKAKDKSKAKAKSKTKSEPRKKAKTKTGAKTKGKTKPKTKAKSKAAVKVDKKSKNEPAAKPKDEPGTEAQGAEGGQLTAETKILACQCGSTRYDVKKRTRTAVALVCAKCGLRTSVKGSVATVRVRQVEIEYAIKHTVVTPESEPDDASGGPAPGEKVGDGTGGVGEKYITLRYRIMKGNQKDVIDRAMEAIRVANCSHDKFREQSWQGHALEYICADFLSGCSHDVLQIVDAMDASVEDAERLAEQDGKVAPAPRKIRDLRATVRDKLALESGILPADYFGEEGDDRQLDLPETGEFVCPECDKPVAESDTVCPHCAVVFIEDDNKGSDGDKPEEEKPDPVADGGRLAKAVSAALETYNIEAVSADVDMDERPNFLVRPGFVPPKDLVDKWTGSGGYLIRILGDERTVDADGNRAAVCVWIAAEPHDIALDLDTEYDDATDDILGDGIVEVVELLPANYDKIKKANQWAQPHFADRREGIK